MQNYVLASTQTKWDLLKRSIRKLLSKDDKIVFQQKRADDLLILGRNL